MASSMRGWKRTKEKRACTDWLDRGAKLGRMCNRLGLWRTEMVGEKVM